MNSFVQAPSGEWPPVGAARSRRRTGWALVGFNGAAKVLALWLWRRSELGAVAAFAAPDLHLLYGLLNPSSALLMPVVSSFRPQGREIWLTIDDGPDPADTPQILDALDRRGTRATFFVVGARARRHPELVREIAARGHSVGHHSDSHPVALFWCAGPARVARELDRGLEALAGCGVSAELFRAPVGIKNLFLGGALERRRLTCVGWTLRSGDWSARDAAEVVRRVRRRARPGAILLMHEGAAMARAVRVRAIAETVAALQADGYRFTLPPRSRFC